MNKLISMDKKYKTRDGRDVRVLCIDNNGACAEGYPVVATVDGVVAAFTATGCFYIDSEEHYIDLVELAQEHSVWLELCTHCGDVTSHVYETEEDMLNSIRHSQAQSADYPYTLLATKKVVITEGESC